MLWGGTYGVIIEIKKHNNRNKVHIERDREAWSAAVHGVSKSQTWLGDWTATTKYTILKPPPNPSPWKNCLPRNWSLVPKRLRISVLKTLLGLEDPFSRRLISHKDDLMTWSHTRVHCFLFDRNETVTESSLHWKAVELGSIFWRKKCEEFMDTLYPHHRQDAVAIVQARSNEAGESTVAGGTHPRHCYQEVPSQMFIWWGRGWHLCVKIRVNWVRLWPPPRPLNQHPYEYIEYRAVSPGFVSKSISLWLPHIDSSSVNLRGWAKFHCLFFDSHSLFEKSCHIVTSDFSSRKLSFFVERTWVWDSDCDLSPEDGIWFVISPLIWANTPCVFWLVRQTFSLTTEPLHLYECRLRDRAFIFFLWVALPNCHLKYSGLIHSSFCTIYLFEYRFRTFPLSLLFF